jgi:uncharacterized membrane protein
MKFNIIQYKEDLYQGFWFIPLAMTLAVCVLFFISSLIDSSHALYYSKLDITLDKSFLESIFSIIATAVITITSITFSITVLTLSIASNQFGHRLLPTFMKQKTTQLTLGFYIGTFIYTILTLIAFSFNYLELNFAGMTIFFGISLGIACFFIFLYFMHFVCHSIQAENILNHLGKELSKSIKRQYQSSYKYSAIENESIYENGDEFQDKISMEVKTKKSGYVQTIDYEKIISMSRKYNLVAKILVSPGQFLYTGCALIRLFYENDRTVVPHDLVQDAFQIGRSRTIVQDIEFGFEQFNEIALRALSPGVNASYLAIHCIDQVFESYVSFLDVKPLPRVMVDEAGQVRVIRPSCDISTTVSKSLDILRQEAQENIFVSMYLMQSIRNIFKLPLKATIKSCLYQQALAIYKGLDTKLLTNRDKNNLKTVYDSVVAAYDTKSSFE